MPQKQMTNKEFLYVSTIEDAKNTFLVMQAYCRNHGDNDLKQLTIADAFACLGGNTIPFCWQFKDVVAYEIDAVRRGKLQLNTQDFGNIRVFGDCLLENGIFDARFRRDVIFLDPPWSTENVFADVMKLCEDISQQTTTKYVFMKLPLRENVEKRVDNNSNFESLQQNMLDAWTDISIETLYRDKKTGPEPTYSIVCACRKETSGESPSFSSASGVRLFLMQLATLKALL